MLKTQLKELINSRFSLFECENVEKREEISNNL